jgi:hypothetical protein
LAVWTVLAVFADRPAWAQSRGDDDDDRSDGRSDGGGYSRGYGPPGGFSRGFGPGGPSGGAPGGEWRGFGDRGGSDRDDNDGDRGGDDRGGSPAWGGYSRGGYGGGFGGGYGGGFGGRPQWGAWGGSRDDDDDDEDRDRDERDGEDDEDQNQKSRVTVDLPETFTAGDRDGDGQIGLYEWRQWKPSEFRLFALYDANRDGFLTPRELVIATEFPPTDLIDELLADGPSPATTRPDSADDGDDAEQEDDRRGPPRTQPTSTQSPRSSRDADGNTPASNAPRPGVKPSEAEARYVFQVLDKNRDGTLTEPEWFASEGTRKGFSDAGARLDLPASIESFLEDYPQERLFPEMTLR